VKIFVHGILSLALGAALAFAASSHEHWHHVSAKDRTRINPMAGNPEAVAAGVLIYRDHCQQCHKANGAGDGGKRPSLRSDAIRNATDGDLEWFLRQGDLAHGMPSWSSLPENQRWQLVDYLRSLQ
jgi:mono/diheme cytochrome c family protein